MGMAGSIRTTQYQFFCSLLAKARESAGLTQAELSTRLGKPQSFVSKYETGERRLDVIEFVQVCTELGVDPVHILTELKNGPIK